MITLASSNMCTGCGACFSVCSQKSITMEPDKDGFLYPQINKETCVKCQKCVYEYISILEKVIQEGIDNGEFYKGDVKALASGIFGVTCSSQIYRMNCNEEVSIEKIYKGFVNTVVRGIKNENI